QMAARLLLVDVAEDLRRRAFESPLAPRGNGDDAEGDQHQQVPLPPGGLPVPREGDRERRLAQKDERDEDRERERARSGPVELPVAPDPEAVGEEADDGERRERAASILRRDWVIERRQSREGDGRPEGHVQGEKPVEDCAVADEERRGLWMEPDCGCRCKEPGFEQSDRRGDLEACVLPGQQNAWRRERMEDEVAGCGEEGEPDEKEARIGAARGSLGEQEAESEREGAD